MQDNQTTTSIQKYKAIQGVVLRIPVGCVASYGQVAALAGLPGRARLAGKALGFKVNELHVPWYRVIRSNGSIAFPIDSLQFKTQTELLADEGVEVKNGRVSMKKFQWDGRL